MIVALRAIYTFSIRLLVAVIGLASIFNEKARLWRNGRVGLLAELSAWRKQNPGKLIWMHCASLGEFEQGRPIIESIKKEFPSCRIILTFFSPSGYEVRKEYAHADYICYLPADTSDHAREFVNCLHPDMAIVVKYEYWANYFIELKNREIPLYIISGILRSDQRFFGVFSSFWKKVLTCVTHFYVQDEETRLLLTQRNYNNVTVAGDTRFDRVLEIASTAKEINELGDFRQGHFCLVAGSSWPTEEKMIAAWRGKHFGENIKIILVPHEINQEHISYLTQNFPDALLWSRREGHVLRDYQILIIDTMGILSVVYKYGDVAFIGGGFGKGIHNVLEAAVWGIPVIFGPNYQKFLEAKELIAAGGAISIKTGEEMEEKLQGWKEEEALRLESGKKSAAYVGAKSGATEVIMSALRSRIEKF